MTSVVHISPEIFNRLQSAGFTAQEIVKITAAIAAYNLTSLFVVTLDVMEGRPPKWFRESRI